MSHLIYTDLISSLLDPRLIDPGSTLIHVGAYDPKEIKPTFYLVLYQKYGICYVSYSDHT